jgi:hypothetical protein
MTSLHVLAQTFAPIVYHDAEEPNLPANVDWFLERTSLWFHDVKCSPPLRVKLIDRPTQGNLIAQRQAPGCGAAAVHSGGTRSGRKQRTFFLADIAPEERCGSPDPRDWTTYYHGYPNDLGGTTIQYWRFHAYNTGQRALGVQFGFHGGDWEGMHVVLEANGQPVLIRLLGHTGISELSWNQIACEATHPVMFSERNGHATLAKGDRDGIRQETWGRDLGATVTWPGRSPVPAGVLLDVGHKTAIANEQWFIQFSGLWGTPSQFPDPDSILYLISSGYWGPAFNETAMGPNGFITAWGAGAQNPGMRVGGVAEYFPTDTTR